MTRRGDMRVGHVRLGVVSDIADARLGRASAVVSPNDALLTASAGVAEKLVQRGGASLRADMDRVLELCGGRVELGDTVATAAGEAGAAYVIHAITLDPDKAGGPAHIGWSDAVLLYGRVLDHAVELGARHLVLPLLTTGAEGVPFRASLAMFAFALIDHAAIPSTLKRVTLVLGRHPPSAVQDSGLEKWLVCCPKLPGPAELAVSRPRSMRMALLEAERQPHGSARVPALLSAVNRGLAAATEMVGQPAKAIEEVLEREGGLDADGTTVDLHLIASLGPDFRIDTIDPVWLGKASRALHRLVASSIFDPPGTPSPNREVAVHDCFILRGWLLVSAKKFDREQPVLPPEMGLESHAEPGPPAMATTGLETIRLSPEEAERPLKAGEAVPTLLDDRTGDQPQLVWGPSVSDRIATQSDTPVRRLARLLLEETSAEERAELLTEASKPGRSGNDVEVLMEHLLEVPPNEALRYLSLTRLRGLARSHGLRDELPSLERCVETILGRFGFTVAKPIRGLGYYRSRILEQQSGFALDSKKAGIAVQKAAQHLERLTKDLLTFHCRHSFHSDSDRVAHERNWLKPSETLARSSLGTLLLLVKFLDEALARDDTREGLLYQRVFGSQRLSPPTKLAEHRNVCAHDRKGDRLATEKDLQNSAHAFFDEATAWLDRLGRSPQPLFPAVVQICGERVDSWGRRTFNAVNDQGQEELLHCAESHDVGANYYMCPRSNPIRVFPILVPAD